MPVDRKTSVKRGNAQYAYKGQGRMHNKAHFERQKSFESKIVSAEKELGQLTIQIIRLVESGQQERIKKDLPEFLVKIKAGLDRIDSAFIDDTDFVMQNKNHPLQKLSSLRIHDVGGSLRAIYTALYILERKGLATQESHKLYAQIGSAITMLGNRFK